MSYLDENGLARYDGLIKNWVTLKSGTVDGVDPLLNWQRTGTAKAVTFYPLPAAPIDPTVNFLFTETGPASGTKGPDNPSSIAGVTQAKATRCGKNLSIFPYLRSGSTTINGVTFTVSDDSSVTVSGVASADTVFTLSNTVFIHADTQYTMTGCPAIGSNDVSLSMPLGRNCYNGGTVTFSYPEDRIASIWIWVKSGTDITTPIVFWPQLELGSTATAFEPYEGADYTIDLGGTFYGGSVDLSTGTMTVTWWGESLSSFAGFLADEGSTVSFVYYSVYEHEGNVTLVSNYLVCDKFISLNDGSDSERCRFRGGVGAANRGVIFYINKNRLDVSGAVNPSSPTSAEWLAAANVWLTNNPIFICYKLFTPTTTQLTPTQIYSLSQLDPYTPRINTVYSDQTSVQVGYPKSPQASQTELTNAIISLGSNL